jgi:hemolysin III
MLLSLSFVFYMITKLTHKAWERLFISLSLLVCSAGLRFLPIPGSLSISLGYLITAITIALPLLIYLTRTGWRHVGWVAGAIGIFIAAVYFRTIDQRQEILTMGTHWIWHLLGGVAVHLLITFIYKDKEVLLTPKSEE